MNIYLSRFVFRFSTKMAAAAAVAIVATFLANTASAGHLEAEQQALSENRQKWDALDIEDYDFQMRRSCFCLPDSVQPGLVHVRGGQIDSVEHAQSGVALDETYFLTVDGLFDYAQTSFDDHAFGMTVTFDATLGYPTNLSIDHNEFFADDEISFIAGELSVVPEPTALALAAFALLTFTYRRPRRCRQACHIAHRSD